MSIVIKLLPKSKPHWNSKFMKYHFLKFMLSESINEAPKLISAVNKTYQNNAEFLSDT